VDEFNDHADTALTTKSLKAERQVAMMARDDRLDHLVHHSDCGSQYTAIRRTDRLVDAGRNARSGRPQTPTR